MFCCVRRGRRVVPPGCFSIRQFTISGLFTQRKKAQRGPGFRLTSEKSDLWKDPGSGAVRRREAARQGQGSNPAEPSAPNRERKSPGHHDNQGSTTRAERPQVCTPLGFALCIPTKLAGRWGGRRRKRAGTAPTASRRGRAGERRPPQRPDSEDTTTPGADFDNRGERRRGGGEPVRTLAMPRGEGAEARRTEPSRDRDRRATGNLK